MIRRPAAPRSGLTYGQPFCDTELSRWQGKHGDNALSVWRQGERHPVGQRVDENARLSDDELLCFRLPERFGLGTACPSDASG